MLHFVLGRTRSGHVQFFRYFFVGGSSAVIDLALYALLLKVFDVHYLVAAFIAYVTGFLWNHLLCVLWVFEKRHSRVKEMGMAFGIALGGLLWTELLLFGFVGFIGIDAFWAKVISQFIVLIWNFSMRKIYVFH